MNTSKILKKFDHNSTDFHGALGVSNKETLTNTVRDWFMGEDKNSKTVEAILSHGTLNDNEKIFCLIELGKIMILHTQFQLAMNELGGTKS